MQEVFEKIINAIEKERVCYFLTISNTGDKSLDVAYEKVGEAIDKAIEIVKYAAEEYNNGWIPCSVVDHPEHCRECEVTMVDTHGYTREIAFYTDRWRRASDEAEIIVIAWKEPSGPYQPKGE